MPPATGNSALPVKPAPCLPELPIGREELTVILNKSAANAVENATRMSVPQSEKAALRETAKEDLNSSLLKELAHSNVKYNPDDVVTVIKNSDGKLIWLEKGNSKKGLIHILERHADDFASQGVDNIPKLLENVLSSKPINTGSNAKGLFADYMFKGNKYRVAYGTNGFVVSIQLINLRRIFMYRVISIDTDEMTKIVKIKNLKTGTIDICFDDSELVSDKNFNFMKVGNEYDCKIKLFGNVVSNVQENAVLCMIANTGIIVGSKKMAIVLIENDAYYIPEKKLNKILNTDKFYFKYTRKDLIAVNNIIHADLL